jgi:hypothetical protein
MESKQTAKEALKQTVEALRAVHVRTEFLDPKINRAIAGNVVDAELGKYADPQPTYHLDQETRDRLLVHARRDAAEALWHVHSLMTEVHRLKSEYRYWRGVILLFCVAYLIWLWAKSGFPTWGLL